MQVKTLIEKLLIPGQNVNVIEGNKTLFNGLCERVPYDLGTRQIKNIVSRDNSIIINLRLLAVNLNADYDYLASLSQECQTMIIDRVNNGGKNLYHSCMAVIENKIKKGTLQEKTQELQAYFVNKSVLKHNITDSEKPLVQELFSYCYDEMIKRFHYKIK